MGQSVDIDCVVRVGYVVVHSNGRQSWVRLASRPSAETRSCPTLKSFGKAWGGYYCRRPALRVGAGRTRSPHLRPFGKA